MEFPHPKKHDDDDQTAFRKTKKCLHKYSTYTFPSCLTASTHSPSIPPCRLTCPPCGHSHGQSEGVSGRSCNNDNMQK